MNQKEFLDLTNKLKYPKMLFLENISFKKEMNLDYFFIRNFQDIGYGIVSQILKDEIEKQDIKGFEFKPINKT